MEKIRKANNESAITLVALIITIIVLIILAAVTIITFTDSGLLETASKGTQNYANAQKYEEEIMQNISDFADDVVRNITSIGEGSGNQPKPDPTPIEIADIGKYVDYKPNSGTYEKATLDQYSGVTTNTAFTTQEDLKWRIWNIDDKNLYLISDKATTQQLTLKDAIGYNNGVTLLDEICDTCYKGNFTGISVKNLKIEDLEDVMEIPKNTQYSTQPYAEFTGNAPYVWRQNESASWEDSKNNRSTPYVLTTQTASGGAMRPWWNTYSETILPAGIYKDVIGSEMTWLSSRYVFPMNSGKVSFGLLTMCMGNVVGDYNQRDGIVVLARHYIVN